ncbi:MAG: recombination-associated protein RdgC [Proteobacteria bacterium]|nr:recombination-associated protein RdgC [Pseudomonadota bacterium]
MGILSSTVSVTRYRVNEKFEKSIIDTVAQGLKKNKIIEIDDVPQEMSVGWTTFENPFIPDFENRSFIYGNYIIFSLRIDKKSIPSKLIKKRVIIESSKKLSESGRDYISRNEKKQIKENVIHQLTLKIPSTPNIYDVLWNYEESTVWFLSTQKSANEEFETLFSKSFHMTLIRLFPYTLADFSDYLSDSHKDNLSKLLPTKFTE